MSSADRELVKYLHFLRRKRDSAIAEVAAEFNELKVSRLFDDENYAAEDVAAMLDGLLALVRSSMKQSLQTTNFGSVLLLKQVLEQCDEAQGLPINIETDLTVMDDRSKLAAVERWDQDVHGGSSSAPPPLRVRAAVSSRQGARALPVIGQAQDPKLLSELQSSRDDHATLQERFNRLQMQCTDTMRQKSAMQAEIDALMSAGGVADADAAEAAGLRQQVADLQADLDEARHAGGGGGGNTDSLMHELHGLQDANAQLTDELDAARADATARVERSTQFVNMRQMLAKKNMVVRQLRDQLAAHGIHVDDVDAVDD